jgi:hypothetical protein
MRREVFGLMRKFVVLYRFAVFILVQFSLARLDCAAATVSVTPSAVSNLFLGTISIQITGLTNGEPVILEKYIDLNNNGVVDAGEILSQSFIITDGQSSAFGGVTNANVPGDLNTTPAAITSPLAIYNGTSQGIGNYIFRVSSPFARFAPVTTTFAVTNSNLGQSINGASINGTNVPNAFILLLTAQGDYVAGTATDGSGNYSIQAVPGTYMLIAVKPGFVGSFSSAPLVTLTAGNNVTTNVSLTPATQTISGRLIDGANSNGIPGIFFFVQSSGGQAVLAYTDASGNFNIPVTAGQWKLRPDSDPLSQVGYIAPGNKVTVDTSTGSVSGITLTAYKATALFYGFLKNSTNSPLAGIQIAADTQDNSYKASGVTDINGYYTIGVLATNWNVGPSSDRLTPLGYTSSGTNSAINAGQAIRIDFVAVRNTASFNGRVVTEAGSPVANIGVSANNNSSANVDVQTDNNGNFTLPVSAGTWTLQLSSSDGVQQNLVGPSLQFSISDGQNLSNIVLVARTGTALISGSVRDGTNGAVANIGVSANATFNGTNYSNYVNTDSSGNYTFPAFNGSWLVNVDCYNLSLRNLSCPNSQFVNISGGNGTANFVVYGPPVGTFSFRFNAFLGDFGAGRTPTGNFPAALRNYRAAYLITDTNPPALSTVTFTGPSGSGLSNTVANGGGLDPAGSSLYLSPPTFLSTNYPSGGTWTVLYKGVPQVFSNVQDPQPNNNFIVPVPTMTLSNDIMKSVSWSYYLANGSLYGGLPPFIVFNLVELFDQNGNLFYQSPPITNATSFVFDQTLNWSQISQVRMRYLDSMTNYYFINFFKSQPNLMSPSRSTNPFQFTVNAPAGVNYSIQSSTNLAITNWTTLLVTNLVSSPLIFIDSNATSKARFYRVLIGP